VVLELSSDRLHGGRLHERHVGRQDQPTRRVRPGCDAGSNRVAHAERRRPVGSDGRQHHHVARRNAASRQVGKRFGGDDDDCEMTGDRMPQGRAEHGAGAQALGQLVVGGLEPRTPAGRQHDHGGLRFHSDLLLGRRAMLDIETSLSARRAPDRRRST
jgi:hypothetical protein